LWDTNFDVSIRFAATYWISIVRRQSELDGAGHNYRLGQMRDQSRSNVLADQGVIVLRFWNHQVRYELDSVLKAIWFALEKGFCRNLHLNPLLSEGRGGLCTVTMQ
jgi:hypothetical protein